MADPHASNTQEPEGARSRGIPLRVLIPNMITLSVLAAGLTAIRFAVEARLEHAVLAIGLAAILDGLDGRVARLLKGSSQFGAELDSLADFISFGCGPALVLYFWSLNELSTLGWVAAISLAFAAALRLARFNVMATDTTRPAWTKGFFTGVPAPAGALLALLPLNLYISGVPRFTGHSAIVAVFTVFVAALMVSRLPTFSGKGQGGRIPRNRVVPIIIVSMVVLLLLFSHPFPTMSAITVAYLATIPYGMLRYRALTEAQAISDAEARGDGDRITVPPPS